MPFDVLRLTSLRRVSEVALSPDGQWLAVVVAQLKEDESGYVSNLWRVDTSGDSPPRQLTRGEDSDSSPRFRRDGSLGFLAKRQPSSDDGDKSTQVWLLPVGGGEPFPLTSEPHGVLSFRFAKDADVLVVLAPEIPDVPASDQEARKKQRETRGESALLYRDGPVRHWDHWVPHEVPRFVAFDGEGRDRRALTPTATDEFREFEFELGWDLSANGQTLVAESGRLADDRLYDYGLEFIETTDGARRPLAETPGVWYSAPRFSPEGSRVIALSEKRPSGTWFPTEIVLCEPGKEPRAVASEFDGVPSEPQFAPDGRSIVFTAALAGAQPVFRFELETQMLERLSSNASAGTHASLRASGDRIFGTRHTLLAPPEPFALGGAPQSEPTLLASLSGLEPDETSFASVSMQSTAVADGSEVPWFLVQPSESSGPRPAQLWIHGGPLGQWSDSWHWRWNPLVAVAAGYACALPNPRGSIGLGKAFTHGIWNNRWGAECFTDLMSVTGDLERRDDIDEGRIAALGGSFGGYMANWIGTQTDRFRCLVSHAGIYHFPAFYGTTDHPPYWRYQMAGDPYSEPEEFVKYSPHRFIDNWKTPVLVIHGELDYRVPVTEALLLFDALRDREVKSELLIFPNENHWILRPHNARRWYGEVMRFIGEHMGQ